MKKNIKFIRKDKTVLLAGAILLLGLSLSQIAYFLLEAHPVFAYIALYGINLLAIGQFAFIVIKIVKDKDNNETTEDKP